METETIKKHILIIEDDKDIACITKMHLEHACYETCIAGSCEEAKNLMHKKFDLVLLDMMLPDGDGLEICTQIKNIQLCPVVFLSCIDDGSTMIEAFALGADDYVVKPVQYDVLLARIEAHVRRENLYKGKKTGARDKESIKRFKSFDMNTVHRNLFKNGEVVALSVIEYELLNYMVSHPDTLLLYDELYSGVWVNESFGDVRTVMVHISNLRKKWTLKKKVLFKQCAVLAMCLMMFNERDKHEFRRNVFKKHV